MRTIITRLAVLAAAALLGACGGGGNEPGSASALPAPSAARAPLNACTTQALASGEYQLVGADCVRASTVIAPQRAPSGALAATPTVTATQLMDWAETTYPHYFPTTGRQSGTTQVGGQTYTYRYYPQALNYLGVSSEATPAVYILGPVSGGPLARVGAVSDFACQVLPSACITTVPGAPTIVSAVGGNALATITVSAPTTGGGGITAYNASCTANSAQAITGTSGSTTIMVQGLTNGTAYSCQASATNSVGTGPFSLAMTVTPSSGTGTTTTQTTTVSTSPVYCGYNYSAYNSSSAVRLTSTVSITCNNTQRVMTSNGVPDHVTGSFPNANNPNTIAAQNYTFTATITPSLAATSTAIAHVTGFANNGVPFDPATAESYQNQGVWLIEAIQSYLNLGLDSSNAHVQPNGAYHYHGIPEGYVTKLAKGQAMTLAGFAMDGYPVYARYGYTTATSATSGIKVVKSSWQLKTTPDSGRPSTTTVPMGTFTQDYRYVAGSGDLDECNGRFGVTPEFPGGIYHYYLTDTWPYIQRCVKGVYTPPPAPPR